VRLMDRSQVPISMVYGADIAANATAAAAAAHRVIRTMNSAANHLGLALPSGKVAVFAPHQGESLLEHESGMRDIAVDEELEIDMGVSADVSVSVLTEARAIDSAHAEMLPLLPGVTLRGLKVDEISRVDISNARPTAIQFELRLRLPTGARVIRADHPVGAKNGRPMFRLEVPANGTATLRYQTEHSADRVN
jgi:hypothetical protein